MKTCTGPEHPLGNPSVRRRFVAHRLGGKSVDQALHEASLGTPYNPRRLPPALTGGADLVPGMRYAGAQFGDRHVRDFHLKKARAAGVNVAGKYFASHLCRPGMPGDPRAWVSGKDEERAKARAMGYTVKVVGAETEYGIPSDKILDAGLAKPKKAKRKPPRRQK